VLHGPPDKSYIGRLAVSATSCAIPPSVICFHPWTRSSPALSFKRPNWSVPLLARTARNAVAEPTNPYARLLRTARNWSPMDSAGA
jgi:hypothetical protein